MCLAPSAKHWGKWTTACLSKATQSLPPSLWLLCTSPPSDLGPQYYVGPSYWGPGHSLPLGSSPLPLPWCLCPFIPRCGWPAGCSDHHPNPALLIHSANRQLHHMENLPPVISSHPPPPAIHMRGAGKPLKHLQHKGVLLDQFYSLSPVREASLLIVLRHKGWYAELDKASQRPQLQAWPRSLLYLCPGSVGCNHQPCRSRKPILHPL